jgi:hypothetical protein
MLKKWDIVEIKIFENHPQISANDKIIRVKAREFIIIRLFMTEKGIFWNIVENKICIYFSSFFIRWKFWVSQ